MSVLCAAIASARPAILRGRQRGLVCAGSGERLLVGGLQAAVEVIQLRIVADQLLDVFRRFGAVESRRGGRCGGARGWMCFRAAGAQNQGRNDDGEQSHTC